jgi:hypothetical protein
MRLDALATQLRRGSIALGGDEAPEARSPGTGRSRLFSARRVLHIALTNELVRCGLPVATASSLAFQFTDVSADTDVVATIDDGTPQAEGRKPGELRAGGRTVFRVCWPVNGGDPIGLVESAANVEKGALLIAGHVPCRAALVIGLDSMHARVMAALGMPTSRHAA